MLLVQRELPELPVLQDQRERPVLKDQRVRRVPLESPVLVDLPVQQVYKVQVDQPELQE